MNDITVITLHGDSGSGKDTTATELQKINPRLPRLSFGALLRQDIYAAYDIAPMTDTQERETQHYYSPISDRFEYMTFKDLMIQFGRVMMLEDPYRYCSQMDMRIREVCANNKAKLVVVTDCRRPHELQVIRHNFPSYSFRLFHSGSTCKALDRLLCDTHGILDMGQDYTIQDNVDLIISTMINTLPNPIEG